MKTKARLVRWLQAHCWCDMPDWLPFPRCGLARLSDRLDQRWGTQVWR